MSGGRRGSRGSKSASSWESGEGEEGSKVSTCSLMLGKMSQPAGEGRCDAGLQGFPRPVSYASFRSPLSLVPSLSLGSPWAAWTCMDGDTIKGVRSLLLSWDLGRPWLLLLEGNPRDLPFVMTAPTDATEFIHHPPPPLPTTTASCPPHGLRPKTGCDRRADGLSSPLLPCPRCVVV